MLSRFMNSLSDLTDTSLVIYAHEWYIIKKKDMAVKFRRTLAKVQNGEL